MTVHCYINILAISFCLSYSLSSCRKSPNKKPAQIQKQQSSKPIEVDTLTTAIIPFNRNDTYPFDYSYKSATLTPLEIFILDSLLITCVNDYNHSLGKQHEESIIDLKHNYRKQVVAVTSTKGNKEVWVNCFCRSWNNAWKEVLIVQDGGNCYFHFKVNLTSKRYYEMVVNGGA